MKVLVTGNHGYVGSVLAPYLADGGHDVTELDTRFYRGCNGDRTLHLAHAAREAGVRRFVFASSCSMYAASNADDLARMHPSGR